MQVNYQFPIYSLVCCEDWVVISSGLGGKQYGQQNKLVKLQFQISYHHSSVAKSVSEIETGEDFVENLAYCPKTKSIIANIEQDCVIYSFIDGKISLICQFSVDKKECLNACKFNESGNLIATGGDDSILRQFFQRRLWDYKEGKVEKKKDFFYHSKAINDLCFIENKLLASVSDDGTCKIFILQTNQLLKVIQITNQKLNQCCYSQIHGNLYVSSIKDSKMAFLNIYDLKDNAQVEKISSFGDEIISQLKLHPNQKWLGGGMSDGTKFCMDLNTNKIVKRNKNHGMVIKGLDFMPSQQLLISGSPDYRYDIMNYTKKDSSPLYLAIWVVFISILVYYLRSIFYNS